MPKSKRDKKISLTKTSKKGVELKQRIINDIRGCAENYDRVFVIRVKNMRNNKFQVIREAWRDSRFFFGKVKIMALALGKTPETEVIDGIHNLSGALKGQCGLLFTNRSKKKVLEYFTDHCEQEFARSGFVSTMTVVLPEGPMPEFPHSIEPHLRQLGMPTALQKGVVTLVKEFEVCKEGQTLTPEQARILKLLNKPMANFEIVAKGMFSKQKGYVKLADDDEDEDENENDDENEMDVEDENVDN